MIVHQISIFVENKSGTLLKVLELFKENNIQLIASTISDTVEYGIYRIICSEPMRAYEMLKKSGISANLSEVFTIMLDNRPGRAADPATAPYYSVYVSSDGQDQIDGQVFRTDDAARTERVIRENSLAALDDKALLSLGSVEEEGDR